jgi:hypothetical protein
MAEVPFTSARAVRLANTHNVLTRTRPVGGPLGVGQTAMMDAAGRWIVADGTTRTFGIVIGISDGRIEGDVGDDAEVLMEGIIAGFDVAPNDVLSQSAAIDGALDDAGTTEQIIGVGMNDGLLYVRPAL